MGPSPLLFLLFVLTLPLPGAMVALRRREAGRGPAAVAAEALVVSLTLTSLLTLGSALAGVFHLGLVVTANAAAGLAAGLFGKDAPLRALRRPSAARRSRIGLPAIFATAVALAAAVLYFRPYENLSGGWDPGVYLSTGASIARTGAVTIHDRTFPTLTAEERALFTQGERMPGKYRAFIFRDPARGVIQPYFYYLYPAWVALLDAGLGPRGGLFAGALFVLCSLLPLFVLAESCFGRKAAVFAVLLFAFSIPTIWQARMPTSEPVALFFFLGGFALLADFERTGRTRSGVVAALAFFCALLVKITSIVPFFLLFAAHRVGRGASPSAGRDRFGWLLAGATALILPYYLGPCGESTRFVLGFSGKVYGPWLLAAGAAAFGAFLVAAPRAGTLLARHERAARIAAALFAALFLFAWFVRPAVEKSSDAANLAELGWFVTPLFLATALAGMLAVLLRAEPGAPRRLQLIFLAVGAGTAAVLLHRKQVDPFYLWALRRWVPELMPAFAVFGGYALALLFGGERAPRARRATALALCVLAVGWGLFRGRHLIAHRDYAGALDGISRVAALVPDDTLAVCTSPWIATPLQYVFGKETLQGPEDLPDKTVQLEATLAAWVGGGRKILLVTDGEYSAEGVGLEPVGSVDFAVPVLERPRTRYPRLIRENRHDVRVYRVVPPAPRR